ncbi:hypothetical protein [Paludisphaera soli]|uniref:hypothetical protein n=1 Tax=Paludisphaera soli TaxID=2712865 RepID=UPI0013EB4F8B|nr:hypothetical protein [Paludisphaera soli]
MDPTIAELEVEHAARLAAVYARNNARRAADPVAYVLDSTWPSEVEYDVFSGCFVEIAGGRLVARLDYEDGTAQHLSLPIQLPADPEAAAALVLRLLQEFHERVLASA